jgi:hypothetical protein
VTRLSAPAAPIPDASPQGPALAAEPRPVG